MYKTNKSYQPPRIQTVEFMVENGYAGSPNPEVELSILGLAPGAEAGASYEETANSWDDFFFHSTTTFGSGGTDYNNYDWQW